MVAASIRRANWSRTTCCETGIGSVLIVAWTTIASVPSDPVMSRERSTPVAHSRPAQGIACTIPRRSRSGRRQSLSVPAVEIVQLADEHGNEVARLVFGGRPRLEAELSDLTVEQTARKQST